MKQFYDTKRFQNLHLQTILKKVHILLSRDSIFRTDIQVQDFSFFFFKTNIHNIRSGTVENIIFAVIPNVISIMSPEKFISNKLLIAQNFEKHFCTIPKHHISFMMITSLQKMNIAAIMCFASSSRLISFCCTEIPPYCICRDLINLVWIISILPRPLTKSQ